MPSALLLTCQCSSGATGVGSRLTLSSPWEERWNSCVRSWSSWSSCDMYGNPCLLCYTTLQRTVWSVFSRLEGDSVTAQPWPLMPGSILRKLIAFSGSNNIQTIFMFLCKVFCRVLLLLLIICVTWAMTFFLSSSEHWEPTEADPPWGPGSVSDGWSCALPPRQSHSPPFSGWHPHSLACGGRIPSDCADDESLPPPSVCSRHVCTTLSSPSSAWPSVGEMWRTSWRPAGKSEYQR